jgi:hypothetical protein
MIPALIDWPESSPIYKSPSRFGVTGDMVFPGVLDSKTKGNSSQGNIQKGGRHYNHHTKLSKGAASEGSSSQETLTLMGERSPKRNSNV